MDKYLFFFILSSALLIISVITICLAPIINAAVTIKFYKVDDTTSDINIFEKWSTESCQRLNDEYKHKKDIGGFNGDTNGREETQNKRKINDCKRHKAMFGLEYAALISDVVLGFICMLLGLIHYLEQGKPFETTSGLIGIASGGIATVLTIVYVVYSGIIFNNEYIRDSDSNILYDNHAYLHWNGNKYVYNYDSEIYQMSLDTNSEFRNCQTYVSLTEQKQYGTSGAKKCEYIWHSSLNESVKAKYLYDRWITSIILSVVICVCGIGLAFFGFLLFKGN